MVEFDTVPHPNSHTGSREEGVPSCRQETVTTTKLRTTPTLSDSGFVESHTPDNAMCKWGFFKVNHVRLPSPQNLLPILRYSLKNLKSLTV